ncbi:hypothetical protein OH77DRAFT_567326 [Trametes cingulata]|nr:hypothetical protein OH77DRAFT_567326 [Trametes cingulata]
MLSHLAVFHSTWESDFSCFITSRNVSALILLWNGMLWVYCIHIGRNFTNPAALVVHCA